jgi:hypothetical protein
MSQSFLELLFHETDKCLGIYAHGCVILYAICLICLVRVIQEKLRNIKECHNNWSLIFRYYERRKITEEVQCLKSEIFGSFFDTTLVKDRNKNSCILNAEFYW